MSLEVKNYHDCKKPDMIVGKETWDVRRGLFMRRETLSRNLYESREARWKCPECDSTWRWSPNFNGYKGSWFAINRTSHWVEIDKP